jgi:hypothetical protein
MKQSILLAVSLTLVAVAASHPNFSGTWKENAAKSTKSNLTSYVNKIDVNGDTIKVTTTTNGPRGERTFDRTYVIGKEVTSKMPDGDDVVTSASWQGDALVIVSTVKEPDGAVESKEVWSLSPDGKTLTKQRHAHGPKGDRDDTHVLEKQ